MKEFLLPFFYLIPDRVAAPRTEIFILLSRGEDQQEPLAYRGRHLAAGAIECRRFKVLIIRLTFHTLKHNARKAVRQGGYSDKDNTLYPSPSLYAQLSVWGWGSW